MEARADVQSLLAEFGTIIGIPQLTLDNEDSCALSFDNYVININYLDEKEQLVIFSDIGRVPSRKRETLFQEMLTANFYREQMAGAVLCYTPVNDSVVLLLQQPVDELRLSAFETMLEQFINLVAAWTKRIENTEDDESTSVSGEGGLPAGMIQPNSLA